MPTTQNQEDHSVNTDLKLRGFEVWAVTPGHYRHYHTLFLRAGEFLTESYQHGDGWLVGFTRPDGQRQSTYGSYKSLEEAEHARTTYAGATTATIGCQFEVGYKKTDETGEYLPYSFCDSTATGAKAWGTTWDTYPAYAPLKFDLTEEEAKQIIAWRKKADAEWFAARPDFLPRENRITEAQVAGLSETAAEFFVDAKDAGLDPVALAARELPTATECLECGAVYDEPGHVEPGAMGCDRCG